MIIPFLPVILGRYVQLTMLLDTTGRSVGGLQSSWSSPSPADVASKPILSQALLVTATQGR